METMSKLKKLFNSPDRFIADAFYKRGFTLPNRKATPTGPTFFAIGFSPWKELLRAYFPDHSFYFLPKNIEKAEFYGKILPNLKANVHSRILIWGMKAPEFVLKEISEKSLPVHFVEDGFIRSVELGANKSHPLSLCFDDLAPYFRCDVETGLERLFMNYDFTNEQETVSDAISLIKALNEKGITKYNFSPDEDVDHIYGPKTKKRILVIGQVANDASLIYGGCEGRTSRELLSMVAEENPDCQIIFRPHPEELAKGDVGENDDIALVVKDNISLSSAFKTVDHVYTYTSLGGLDALIRGIAVTTVGAPFYSNWGLTDDRIKVERRKRKLSIEELVAVAYLVYPKYYDPYSYKLTTGFDVVNFIDNARKHWLKNNRKKNDILAERNYKSWKPEEGDIKANLYCDKRTVDAFELDCLTNVSKRADVKLSVDVFDISVTPGNVTMMIQSGLQINEFSVPRPFLGKKLGNSAEDVTDEFVTTILKRAMTGKLSLPEARFMCSLLIENGRHSEALSLSREFNLNNERLTPTRIALDGGIYHKDIHQEILALSGLWKEGTQKEADIQYSLRKCWRIYGVNQLSKMLFDRAFQKSSAFNHETLMLLAAYFLEAGQANKSLELCKRAAAIQPAAWKWTRYLALSHLLYQEGLSRDRWAGEDASLFEELKQSSNRFQRVMSQHRDSFAVVGNSPILVGSSSGAEIDNREVVIRFNSAIRTYPHSIDSGTKMNILVLNPDFSQTKRQDFRSLDLAVISDGDMYSSRNLFSKLNEIRGKCTIQLLDSSVDRLVVEEISASPSSGLKTLYWLYSLFGPLKKSDVFGFSLNDQRPGTASSYSKKQAVRMPIVHAWDAERILFDRIVTG